MTVPAFRIAKKKFAAAAFTGEGAKRFGGRWNSPGVAVVYASATLSLATLELLVHLDAPAILEHYVAFEVRFDESLVWTPARFPCSWNADPAPPAAQHFGDRWAVGLRSAVLRVPSAIIPGEFNFVLNPAHNDFGQITVRPLRRFALDRRLA